MKVKKINEAYDFLEEDQKPLYGAIILGKPEDGIKFYVGDLVSQEPEGYWRKVKTTDRPELIHGRVIKLIKKAIVIKPTISGMVFEAMQMGRYDGEDYF